MIQKFKHGDRLGSYVIEAHLAAGGMGEIYRARDPRLDRPVAIKVLPAHAAFDPLAQARFEREARAVAALSHPNILVIHDIGVDGGAHFAVTELLEGETLSARIKRGRLPWQEAADIAADIADGLVAAHSKGVVHRDLKPHNIFLTLEGRVKVLDFGLASFDPARRPTEPDDHRLHQTPPGSVVGTVGYMSPEQLLGEEVDHRTDLFALGCVLYQALSGRKPFTAETLARIIAEVLRNHPPTPSSQIDGLPPALDKIVERCMHKERQERYASAAEVAAALRALLPDRGQETPFSGSPPTPLEDVAVLPFVHASGNSELDFLSDGLSESIIRAISRLGEPRALAWSTAWRYKNSSLEPAVIGRALGVAAVITGRVHEHQDRLIVTVELVASASGELLWGERYDRELGDVFAAHDEIARSIAGKLRPPAPSRAAVSRPVQPDTRSSEAYKCYLRGRHFWNRRTAEGLRRSRLHFQEALSHDPSFARAHVGLADAFNVLPFWGLASPGESFPEAKAAARRALEIDPALAEAYASLAYTSFYFDHDWPAAERGFTRTLELDPSYASARHWYGVCAALAGDFGKAHEQLAGAQELDPLSLIITADLGLVAYFRGDLEQALRQCRMALDLDANFAPAHLYRGLALESQQDHPAALAAFERAAALSGQSTACQAALAHGLARAGEHQRAVALRDALTAETVERYVSPYPLAVLCESLGDRQQAFAWLEQAVSEKCETLPWLRVDPRLEELRIDRRFRGLTTSLEEKSNLSG